MSELRSINGPNAAQLDRYLKLIVEPTFADFEKNRTSIRHAFLACVAAFHSVDRAAYPDPSGNLRKAWRDHSCEFLIVDMVAHHFKHVKSSDERYVPKEGIPLSFVVFGSGGSDTQSFNDISVETRNLFFVIRDAIEFLKKQVGATTEAEP